MSESPYPASTDTPDTSPTSLRLISCNLQHGTPSEGWDKKKGSMTLRGFASNPRHARGFLVEAAQQLKEYHPDILLLQEVDMRQLRSGNLNQAECLAQALKMDYWEYAPAYSGHIVGIHHKPQSLLAPAQRGYGLAILSRFPIQRSLSLVLPGYASLPHAPVTVDANDNFFQRTRTKVQAKFKHYTTIITNNTRIIQGALIETPLGLVAFGNAHLETNNKLAQRQARLAWKSLTSLEADAYILAGDFNLSPKTLDKSLEKLVDVERPASHYTASTFPAWNPRHQLDQFLFTGLTAQNQPQTRRLPISDHLCIMCDFSV